MILLCIFFILKQTQWHHNSVVYSFLSPNNAKKSYFRCIFIKNTKPNHAFVVYFYKKHDFVVLFWGKKIHKKSWFYCFIQGRENPQQNHDFIVLFGGKKNYTMESCLHGRWKNYITEMRFCYILVQQNYVFAVLCFFYIDNKIMIPLCFCQKNIFRILLKGIHVSSASNKW